MEKLYSLKIELKQTDIGSNTIVYPILVESQVLMDEKGNFEGIVNNNVFYSYIQGKMNKETGLLNFSVLDVMNQGVESSKCIAIEYPSKGTHYNVYQGEYTYSCGLKGECSIYTECLEHFYKNDILATRKEEIHYLINQEMKEIHNNMQQNQVSQTR